MNLKVNIMIEHVLVKSRVNIMVMNSKKFNVKKIIYSLLILLVDIMILFL